MSWQNRYSATKTWRNLLDALKIYTFINLNPTIMPLYYIFGNGYLRTKEKDLNMY